MNYLPKITFVLLCFISLVSCKQNQSAKHIEAVQDQATKLPNALDTFSAFPPEINGCACYFSNNESEFKKSAYIYADNYENLAFLYINGVLTKFKLLVSKQISDKHLIKTYENSEFELIVDIMQVGELDETWQQKGILKLTRKGGKTIIKNIYGECGC